MEKYFLARELDPAGVEKVGQFETSTVPAISVVGGNFSWINRVSTSQALALKNINLEVKQNELVGICGAVGCGMSSPKLPKVS